MTNKIVVEPTLLYLAAWLTSEPMTPLSLDRYIAARLLQAAFHDERGAALAIAGLSFVNVETGGRPDFFTEAELGRFIGKPSNLGEEAIAEIMRRKPDQDQIPPWLRQSKRRMRLKAETSDFFDFLEGVLRRRLITGKTAILARIGHDMATAWRPYAVVPDRKKLGPSGKTTIRLVDEMIADGTLVAFRRTGLTFGGAEWLDACRRDITRTSQARTLQASSG